MQTQDASQKNQLCQLTIRFVIQCRDFKYKENKDKVKCEKNSSINTKQIKSQNI